MRSAPRLTWLSALCFTLHLFTVSITQAVESSPPSIFLLTIDTLREDGLPAPGHNRNIAPFLSGLAATSVRFTSAHSTSSWTVPAVASLLTGLYPHSHGVVHGAVNRGIVADQEVLPGSLASLPEELQKLGYRTFGVTANAHLPPEMGYGRGFDRYVSIGVEPAEKVNQALFRWKSAIESSPGPVFIWVHYYDPHHPYVQHEPWFGEFAGGVTAADSKLLLLASKSPPTPPRKAEERPRFVRIARSLYDSEIRYLDDRIAELYRDLPLLNDCLAVITGDHGEEFLEHGGMIHCRNLHAETVRVPLLLRPPGGVPGAASASLPGLPAGRVALSPGACSALVSLVDVPVTLLKAAGGSPPAAWAGRSLFEATADPGSFEDRVVLAELERNRETGLQQALIGSRHKMMRTRSGRTHELYDVQADPGERTNLAGSDAALAGTWIARLDGFLKSLPPPPLVVERKPLSREARTILKGQGYIH